MTTMLRILVALTLLAGVLWAGVSAVGGQASEVQAVVLTGEEMTRVTGGEPALEPVTPIDADPPAGGGGSCVVAGTGYCPDNGANKCGEVECNITPKTGGGATLSCPSAASEKTVNASAYPKTGTGATGTSQSVSAGQVACFREYKCSSAGQSSGGPGQLIPCAIGTNGKAYCDNTIQPGPGTDVDMRDKSNPGGVTCPVPPPPSPEPDEPIVRDPDVDGTDTH